MSEIQSGTGASQTSASPEGGSTTQQTPNKETQPQLSKKAFKFVVDGQETSMELDDNEIAERIQKSLGAEKRFKEAAKEREEFSKKLKTKPWDVFKEHGLDPYELASKYVVEKYEYDQLSPEQKKLKELEEENNRFKASEAQRKYQEDITRLKVKYDAEMAELVKRNKRFEKPSVQEEFKKRFLADHADYEGEESPSLLPYYDTYSKNHIASVKEFLMDLSPEELGSFLDDSLMTKFREHLTKPIKAPQPSKGTATKADSEIKSWADAFKK